jgi:uncharacterized protein YggE
VTVRDLGRLGDLLDGALTAGADGVGGVRFFVTDDTALRDRPRRAAVTDARRAAKVLAEAADARLGRIMSIAEGGASPAPRPRALAMAAGSARVPVAPGEIVARVRVHVVYVLKPGN